MYKIVYSNTFKCDLRKLVRSGKFNLEHFHYVVNLLSRGKRLSVKYKKHKLKGKLAGFYECHISPDILLIYETIEDVMILHLLRVGSHSDLFL